MAEALCLRWDAVSARKLLPWPGAAQMRGARSIDISADAIAEARQGVNRAGLANVEFRCEDLSGLLSADGDNSVEVPSQVQAEITDALRHQRTAVPQPPLRWTAQSGVALRFCWVQTPS